MKNIILVMAVGFTLCSLCGCSGFMGGGAVGAAGTGAGYEYNAHRQLEKLDKDLKAGRIDQKEYDIRKDQINRGSIVY
jgi:hypothetical protein